MNMSAERKRHGEQNRRAFGRGIGRGDPAAAQRILARVGAGPKGKRPPTCEGGRAFHLGSGGVLLSHTQSVQYHWL